MARIVLRAGKVAVKVTLPIMILAVLLYSVKLLTPVKANEPPPGAEDVAGLFEQAEIYEDEGDYARAEQIYEDIVQEYPGSDQALEAQRNLICQYVTRYKQQDAEAALQELVEVYSEHAGAAKAVCEIADRYLDTNPAKALALYQYTMENWSSMEDVMWAQTGLVKAHVISGDEGSAETAYQTLLAQFLEHENIPEAIYEVADASRASNSQKALELYEYAMNTWPGYNNWVDENDALLRRKNLVLLKLDLGDEVDAQAAYDSMVTFSADDIATAEAVTELANAYLDLGKHQRARELFEYTKGLWSGAGVSEIWAQVGLAKTDIALENDPNNEALEGLLIDFAGDQDLPTALFAVAQQHYKQGFRKDSEGYSRQAVEHFRSAITGWERMLEEVSESCTTSLAAETYHLIGDSYGRLCQFEEALENYTTVTNNWPDYEYIWHVELLTGFCYEEFQRAGTMPKSEAEGEMRSTYQWVVDNFPDSPGARVARNRLTRLEKLSEGE